MSVFVAVSGSPSDSSRTDAVLDHVVRRARVRGHEVHEVRVRDLPAEALLRGRVDDPEVAAAVALIQRADGVLIGTPVYQAAYSGLLKVFLDVLPRRALADKDVLPLVTGGSLAHAAVLEYALLPVLRALQPRTIAAGRFVLADGVRLFHGGGTTFTPELLDELGRIGRQFVATVEGTALVEAPAHGEVRTRVVEIDDPALIPLLEELQVEYGTRYGGVTPNERLVEVPIEDFSRPRGGAFVLLERDGIPVAGGAIRRHHSGAAEVKRMWTSHAVRRQGLARRVLDELEVQALLLGYERVVLSTGPRQPEARSLYLNTGYRALFDLDVDPEAHGPLFFEKDLAHAALLAG